MFPFVQFLILGISSTLTRNSAAFRQRPWASVSLHHSICEVCLSPERLFLLRLEDEENSSRHRLRAHELADLDVGLRSEGLRTGLRTAASRGGRSFDRPQYKGHGSGSQDEA